MQSLLRSDAPLVVRLVVVAIGLFVVMAAALVIPAAMHPTSARLLATYALVIAGFLALPVASTPRFPRLPFQITISIAIVTAACVLFLMDRTVPIRDLPIGPQASLMITVGLAGIVLAAHAKWPRLAFWVLMILGVKAALTAASAVATGTAYTFPASAQFALVLNALWICGSLAAAWHGRRLAMDAATKR